MVAADSTFFDETFGDFTEELTHAREQGKVGVFVFFEMDECPFCHRMKTFSQMPFIKDSVGNRVLRR